MPTPILFDWTFRIQAPKFPNNESELLPQVRLDLHAANATRIYAEPLASFYQTAQNNTRTHVQFTDQQIFNKFPDIGALSAVKLFFKIFIYNQYVASTIEPNNIIISLDSAKYSSGYFINLHLLANQTIELSNINLVSHVAHFQFYNNNQSKRPVAGVAVQAVREGAQIPFARGLSDDFGHVVLSSVDCGGAVFESNKNYEFRAFYKDQALVVGEMLTAGTINEGFFYTKEHTVSAGSEVKDITDYSTSLSVLSQLDGLPLSEIRVEARTVVGTATQVLDTQVTDALGKVRFVLSRERMLQTLGFVPEKVTFGLSTLELVEPIAERVFEGSEQLPVELAWVPVTQEQNLELRLNFTRPIAYQDIFETDAPAGYVVRAARNFATTGATQVGAYVLDQEGRFVFDLVSGVSSPSIRFTLHATVDAAEVATVTFTGALTPRSETGAVVEPKALLFSYTPPSTGFDATQVIAALRSTPYQIAGGTPASAFGDLSAWRENVVTARYVLMKTTQAWMTMQAGHGDSGMSFDPPSCACEGCVTAVSTTAYLVDLMRFCEQKVKLAGETADPARLTTHFKQNFSDLSTSCALSKTTYSMATLGAEVLRRALPTVTARREFARREDVRAFRQAVYERLLTALRIDMATYRGLERIITTNAAAREAVAHEAGLALEDFLKLVLDPYLDPVPLGAEPSTENPDEDSSMAISEQKLEWLFGWVATEHELLLVTGAPALNPLRAPTTPQLLSWRRNYLEASWANEDHDASVDPFEPPIIEPDLVSVADFVPRVGSVQNPGLTLLVARRTQVDGWVTTLNAARASSSGVPFENVLEAFSELALDIEQIEDARDTLEAGQDIAEWLVEHKLTLGEFRVIAKLLTQHQSGSSVVFEEQEWQELIAILTQARKRAQYSTWRSEEPAALHFGPKYFAPVAEAFDVPAPLQTPAWFAWRHNARQRQARQQLIKQRTASYNALEMQLKEAVQRVEEETLDALRTALIKHHAQTPSLDQLELARELGQRYFVDFVAAPELRRDRVSFAIDTLQDLLFSARAGLLALPGLAVSMDNWDFEQAWQWLGKYETWAAGMMVTLYPENFLDPSWHRESSNVFKNLINDIKSESDFNDSSANSIIEKYKNDLNLLQNLLYITSCKSFVYETDLVYDELKVISEREAFYIFSKDKNGDFWLSLAYILDEKIEQDHWQKIKDFDESSVGKIIGVLNFKDSLRLFTIKDYSEIHMHEYLLKPRSWVVSSKVFDLPYKNNQEINYSNLALSIHKTETNSVWLCSSLNMGRDVGSYVLRLDIDKGLANYVALDGQIEISLVIDNECFVYATKEDGLYGNSSNLYQDALFLKTVKYIENKMSTSSSWRRVIGELPQNRHLIFLPQTDNTMVMLELYQLIVRRQRWFNILSPGSPSTRVDIGFNVSSHFKANSFIDSNEQSLHFVCGGIPAILTLKRDEQSFLECKNNYMVPISSLNIEQMPISKVLTDDQIEERKRKLPRLFSSAEETTPQNLQYFRECYYFLPMLISNRLRRSEDYIAALDWLRTVYDYSKPVSKRWVYPTVLSSTEQTSLFFARDDAWMMDPTDPHALASQNPQAYARYTLMELLGCLLDYADSQFQLDTKESVVKARRLYSTVIQILEEESALLPQEPTDCDLAQASQLANLPDSLGADLHPLDDSIVPAILASLEQLESATARDARLLAIQDALDAPATNTTERASATLLAASNLPIPSAPQALPAVITGQMSKLSTLISQRSAIADDRRQVQVFGSKMVAQFNASVVSLLGETPVDGTSGNTSWLASGSDIVPSTGRYNLPDPRLRAEIYRPNTAQVQTLLDPLYKKVVTAFYFEPVFAFCVPNNPTYKTAAMRAQLNLFKIAKGYNFAGLPRAQFNYEDVVVNRKLPMLSATVNLPVPGASPLRTTPYRASYLLSRAQNLVSLAQQIEAQFLNAIEKREQENYALLLAEQSVAMSRKSLAVQDSRLREVEFQQNFASINIAKSQAQLNYYNDLISEGILEKEKVAIGMMITAGVAQAAGSFFTPQSVFTAGASGALAATAAAASTTANVLQTFAAYERRDQEWRQQRQLSQYDVKLAQLQQQQGQLQLRTANQERAMVELQTTHASQVLTFLTQKFTNAELYDWMSGVLGGIYRNLLGQASHIARLAADQLAFERQDASLKALIATDYGQRGVEQTRLGLTGSARLLQDLQTLEQQALLSQRRLLQMTRTFSLSRLAPDALLSLRQDGGATFAIPAELLDAEFPGHTHRTVHHVTISLLAITPAIEGIRASLTCSAARRVGDPARIDFTAPYGATGLFALDAQSELLRPFEGIALVGEDGAGSSNWSLEIPRITNPLLDYETIADVLLTVEYTARHDAGKEQRIRQALSRQPLQEERRFSLRNEFADAWYTLVQQAEAMEDSGVDGTLEASFVVRPRDFAPGRQQLETYGVSVLCIPAQDQPRLTDVEVELARAVDDAASATFDGKGSLYQGWANKWTGRQTTSSMVIETAHTGYWTVRFLASSSGINAIKQALLSDELADIVLSVSYKARLPSGNF